MLLFRFGAFVGIVQALLISASFTMGSRQGTMKLYDYPWPIVALVTCYIGIIFGASLAVGITGYCAKSIYQWEAHLHEWVSFLTKTRPAIPKRVAILLLSYLLGRFLFQFITRFLGD